MRLRAVLVTAFMAVLLTATRGEAQNDTIGFNVPAPKWVGQFTTFSANAVLGGVTAGVIQRIRGGSFKDGFTRGAFGGAIIYSGKKLAASRFFGAGVMGREVAAVGSSVVRNASEGRGTFDRLVFPVAFVKLYWDRTAGSLQPKLDVVSAGYTIYGIVEDELKFDAHESASAGMMVFRTDNKVIATKTDDQHAAGLQAEGVILRADVPGFGEKFLKLALAHERVHVLQDDQIFLTLNDPVDDWVWRRTTATRKVGRFVDINISTEMLRQLSRLIPNHADRPWELEATYLTR